MFTKEQVRKWMQQRHDERKPIPTQEEIKRQLGHELLQGKSDKRTR
jgi:hypothetical protein